jgi:hypothetical protein
MGSVGSKVRQAHKLLEFVWFLFYAQLVFMHFACTCTTSPLCMHDSGLLHDQPRKTCWTLVAFSGGTYLGAENKMVINCVTMLRTKVNNECHLMRQGRALD